MIDYILEDHQARVIGVAWKGDRFATKIPGAKRQEEIDLSKLTKEKVSDLHKAETEGDAALKSALESIKRGQLAEPAAEG